VLDASHIKLRAAAGEDAELLREWRNDPEVRAASRNSHAVDGPEHRQWLTRTLADPECDLLIAELDGEPIGQVRFEPGAEDAHEISVTLAESSRRRGLGAALIRAGVAWIRRERGTARVIAEVRADNKASLHAFRKAGFDDAGSSPTEGFVRLELFSGE
jgi:RimJ/RimL family protein N-acetyltransferase